MIRKQTKAMQLVNLIKACPNTFTFPQAAAIVFKGNVKDANSYRYLVHTGVFVEGKLEPKVEGKSGYRGRRLKLGSVGKQKLLYLSSGGSLPAIVKAR